MDEACASLDYVGCALVLPSPIDTTFRFNDLPLSNIHPPANADDPSSQRRQSRHVLDPLLAQQRLSENIHPKWKGVDGKMSEGGRSERAQEASDDNRLLERIVAKKYPTRALEHEEDSTRHGSHIPQRTQSSECCFSVPDRGNSTVIPRIHGASADSKSLMPVLATDSSKRNSLHRDWGSPEKITASLAAPPSSEQGTPNTPPHLDYHKYLNLDEYYHNGIDGSRHEPDECSTRPGRIGGSHTDMLGVSVVVGGGEAEILGTQDISPESDTRQAIQELFSTRPQAEVLNDVQWGLPRNGNVNIEQPEGQSGNIEMAAVGQGSAREESLPPEIKPEGLLTQISQNESEIELGSRLKREHRWALREQELLAIHWKQEHTKVRQTVQDLECHILKLEEEVRKTTEKGESQARSHSAMVHKLTYGHKEELFEYRQQALTILEERIEYYEGRYKQQLQEAQETDRTVAHLRQTLEMEQKALVKQLQAELEGMTNIMPFDRDSSRAVEGDENDEWQGGSSREISQYYGDSPDQIVTELHGSGEIEDLDEAAEEVEMSRRRVTAEAGLDEPLDRTSLTTFGIGQLRTKYVLLEKRLIESEERVNELEQVNGEMSRREEQIKGKVGVLEGEEYVFKRTIGEAEEKAKKLSQELGALEAKLREMETCIRQLTLEKGELSKKNNDLEGRVNPLESDNPPQRAVNDINRLHDVFKTQPSEEGMRIQSIEEEILGLRRQLAEENEQAGVIETETLFLRKQIAELEEASPVLEKSKENLETRIKRIPTSAATMRHLLQTLFTTKLATYKLTKKKESLNYHLDKSAQKSEASRTRLTQLLHDMEEKEGKWGACNKPDAYNC